MADHPDRVDIDGGVLEGGGQILRISVSLSAIKGIPIRVFNIRAGRSTPGLRPQHIAGLQLVRDICGGTLIGGEIGSTEITFNPGKIQGGHYKADPKTAGSIALLMQVAVPVALYANGPVTLNLRGATNADLAPPIDYMQMVFQPLLARFGGKIDINVKMRGYFPRGGGEVTVQVNPMAPGAALKPVQMLTRGPITRVWGAAYVAGTLPIKIAQVMAGRAREVIHRKLHGACTSIPVDVTTLKEPPNKAVANGSGINLFGETGEGYLLGTSGIGSPKVQPEVVAGKAAEDLAHQLDGGACVDMHAQDQIILLMALASGFSKVLCGELTLHTKTAVYVTELLTKVKFKENDGHLECEGMGHTPTP
ncbi:RNA 3'-terminal phosphate cyclase [Ischnura elegans]|uniref:RNA 3'-terminal phosphate cyclase n=1 Tax=Ischnura elegans TaxID=197161 RepID=UPI001ED88F7A|nr:RNA 3'-terminal phosphate cyclase [Ischnura elegans]